MTMKMILMNDWWWLMVIGDDDDQQQYYFFTIHYYIRQCKVIYIYVCVLWFWDDSDLTTPTVHFIFTEWWMKLFDDQCWRFIIHDDGWPMIPMIQWWLSMNQWWWLTLMMNDDDLAFPARETCLLFIISGDLADSIEERTLLYWAYASRRWSTCCCSAGSKTRLGED